MSDETAESIAGVQRQPETAEFVTDKAALLRLIEAASAMVAEAHVEIDAEGVAIHGVDLASVGMMWSRLPAAECDSFASADVHVAVPLDTVGEHIRRLPDGPLSVRIEADELWMSISGGDAEAEIELIDPDSVRRHDHPEWAFEATASMNAPAFLKAISNAVDVASKAVRLDIDKGMLIVAVEKDLESYTHTLSGGHVSTDGVAGCIYPSGYLEDIAEGLQNPGGVRVSLSEEFPLAIKSGETEYFVAPRAVR